MRQEKTTLNDIESWREQLVQRLLRIGLGASSVPFLMSLAVAVEDASGWPRVLGTGLALAALAWLAYGEGLSPHARARGVVAVLAYLSAVLLLTVGGAAQVFALAVPVLAGLLFHGRSTALVVVAATAGLTLLGALFDVPMPLAGFGHLPPWQRWVVVGANFGLMAGMLALSTRFLLNKFERTLHERHQDVQALRESQLTLRDIAEQVPGMVYRLLVSPGGHHRYLYVSPGARDVLGVEPDALRDDPSLLMRSRHPDDRDRIQRLTAEAYEHGVDLDMEYRLQRADGQVRWVRAISRTVGPVDGGQLRSGILQDVTARKEAEERMWRQAHFDALTALPNRAMLSDRVDQAMRRCRREGGAMALMLIDLDDFKEVNDSLGHTLGDRLLVLAAERIQGQVRASDCVARMGGDEFVVVLEGLEQIDRVALVAQALVEAISQPFELNGRVAHVSASVGITLFPEDGQTLEDLLKNADRAMYQAKAEGRRGFRFFTAGLQEEARYRARLAGDLRDALPRNELRVVYQPIVDLGSGRVVKAEALLRWGHPELGPVSPAVFVPLAESTGLIGSIGDWVLRTAALQAKEWRSRLDPGFQVSVNRSPAQFRAGTRGGDWVETLRELGVPGAAIAIEITEGLLLDANSHVQSQLLGLRDAGVAVALDDFGTGYSALAYLQRFDIDLLKIDGSFVKGLVDSPAAGAPLCRAMIRMAHELGMVVVAEGVETEEQARWLQEEGCDFGQGYFFARPMSAQAMEGVLRSQQAPVNREPAGLPATAG